MVSFCFVCFFGSRDHSSSRIERCKDRIEIEVELDTILNIEVKYRAALGWSIAFYSRAPVEQFVLIDIDKALQ
jgi:hypothetical protein